MAGTPQVDERFGCARRLRSSRDFARLKRDGRRSAVGCVVLNWGEARTPEVRLGVVTSRQVGRAVDRNRARRLLREAFRRWRGELPPADIVLVARVSIRGLTAGQVERDVVEAFRRARLLGRTPPAAASGTSVCV